MLPVLFDFTAICEAYSASSRAWSSSSSIFIFVFIKLTSLLSDDIQLSMNQLISPCDCLTTCLVALNHSWVPFLFVPKSGNQLMKPYSNSRDYQIHPCHSVKCYLWAYCLVHVLMQFHLDLSVTVTILMESGDCKIFFQNVLWLTRQFPWKAYHLLLTSISVAILCTTCSNPQRDYVGAKFSGLLRFWLLVQLVHIVAPRLQKYKATILLIKIICDAQKCYKIPEMRSLEEEHLSQAFTYWGFLPYSCGTRSLIVIGCKN